MSCSPEAINTPGKEKSQGQKQKNSSSHKLKAKSRGVVCAVIVEKSEALPNCLMNPHLKEPQELPTTLGSQTAKTDGQTPEEQERKRVVSTLQAFSGNRGAAADALGISRSTLWRKIKKWGL